MAPGDVVTSPPVVSNDEAAAVFRRAAQLQSAALARLEARARETLPSAGLPGEARLSLEELIEIGNEVGIEPDYIRMALAERSSPAESAGRVDALGTRLFLGHATPATILASRVFAAPPAAVLEALRRVLPAEPYALALADTLGDPLDGGVLVFRVPPLSTAGRNSTLSYDAAGIDVERIAVNVRRAQRSPSTTALPDAADERTELQLSADLRRGARRGWRVAGILGSTLGTAGGIGATVLSAAALGPLALLAGAGAFLLGEVVVGRGFGAIYAYYLRRFTEDLDGLLSAVAANLATGGTFGAPLLPGPRSE